MSEPMRVLAEGTIRYIGRPEGQSWIAEWRMARVFVIDYRAGTGGGTPYVTVVAREEMLFSHNPVPSPVGSIHSLPAYMDDMGDLLVLDVDALVPA